MSYREKAQARAEALLSRGQGYVLAVESSCDETAAAVVDLNQRVYSNVVASSAKVFEAYGGVVPEIASRKHMELLPHVVEKALCDAGLTLDDIDCVAGTMGPGLVGALLCGLSYAKALAFGRDLPFIGVNHMEGHIAANQLEGPMDYPHICLTVSGGHTQLLYAQDPVTFYQMGQTVDDAAGEAFDKAARALDLPYPGGPNLERLAREGDENAYAFTRPKLKRPIDVYKRQLWTLLPLVGTGAYLYLNYAVAGNPFQFLTYQKEHWYNGFASYPHSLVTTTRHLLQNAEAALTPFWITQFVAILLFGGLLATGGRKLHPTHFAYAVAGFYLMLSQTWLLSGARYLMGLALPFYILGRWAEKPLVDSAVTLLSVLGLFAITWLFASGIPIY